MASILDTPTSTAATTLAFTVSAGSNRCLIVGLTGEGSQSGNHTCDYGGQTMQLVATELAGSGTTQQTVSIFFLNDAGIEAATDNVITPGNITTDHSINAASYEDCVQTTPTNTDTDTSGAATPNPLAALDIVTGAANAVVCAVSGMGNVGTAAWATPLTERTEQATASATGSYADDEVPSATTIACECTWTTQNRAAAVACELVHEAGIVQEQEGHQFYRDDGDEDESTTIVAQDANISRPRGRNVRLRILNNVTGDPPNQVIFIQGQKVGDTDQWRNIQIFEFMDSYNNVNVTTAQDVGNSFNERWGQSFIGSGGLIDVGWFWISKVLSPTGTLVFEIYAHTGTYGSTGTPTGSILATSVTQDVSLLPTFPIATTVALSFATPFQSVLGTPYFIVCRYTGGDGTNLVRMQYDLVHPSHEGNRATQVNNGDSWSTGSGDFVFAITTGIPTVGSPQ